MDLEALALAPRMNYAAGGLWGGDGRDGDAADLVRPVGRVQGVVLRVVGAVTRRLTYTVSYTKLLESLTALGRRD